AFLRKEENRKTIVNLLSESDLLILAAVHYIKDATTQKLSDFFSASINFAKLYERLLNLEERLLIYRHGDKNTRKTIISLNPALEDVILPLLSKKILLPLPVLEARSDIIPHALSPEKTAAFVNFIWSNPSLCRADGSIKKRDSEKLAEIFGKETAAFFDRLIHAFINLSLVKETAGGFEVDRERMDAFASLDERLQYAYLCVSSNGRYSRSALVNQAKLLLETADALPATGFSRTCVLRTAFLIYDKIDSSSAVSERLSGGRFASILSRAADEDSENDSCINPVPSYDNPCSVIDRLLDCAVDFGIFREYGRDENGETVYVKGSALDLRQNTPDGESPKVLNIDAAFNVTVFPGLKLKELLPLMLFLDLKQFDTAAVFEISRKSVMRAFDSHLKTADIYALLEKYCAYGVPENLKVSIEDWSNSYSSASLFKGYVLKVDEKSSVLIENNPAILPHIYQTIAPGVFLLDIKSDEDAEDLIRQSGLDFIGSVQKAHQKISGQVFPVFQVNTSAGSALLGGGTAQLRGGVINEEVQPYETEDSGTLTTDEERKAHFDMLRALLEKMAITPEQKEGLLIRINRKIILTPAQLNADSIKLEQIEANGMDYQGKVHVAESAITQNMMLELEFDDKNAPGGIAVIVGTPLSVEKNPLDSVVHMTVEPENEERTFSLGRARNVKRIRGSVFK
ncbi:MAG: helicase-associated domain-containing protein, partial [Treponema sp.]|nr:helicase-associated domain-containing protein [Treponema sp.]